MGDNAARHLADAMNWAGLLGGFDPPTFAAALMLVFGASLVRAVTGFGLGIIPVPFLGLLVLPPEAVGI